MIDWLRALWCTHFVEMPARETVWYSNKHNSRIIIVDCDGYNVYYKFVTINGKSVTSGDTYSVALWYIRKYYKEVPGLAKGEFRA